MSGEQLKPIVMKLNVLSVPVSQECAEAWNLLHRPMPWMDAIRDAMLRDMILALERYRQESPDLVRGTGVEPPDTGTFVFEAKPDGTR